MAALRSHALRSLRNLSTQSAKRPPFSSSVFDRAAVVSHGIHAILPRDSNRMSARWRVSNSNAGSNYSPLGNGPPNWSDRPPTEMAPLFPGCDYEHWLVVMDAPGDGKATKQEMLDCYVKTLATLLGSEEEAIKSIYNVSTERYYGFGCQISEETSYKVKELPGVCFVLPDSYVDPTNKDYGGELFVNGKVVQRPPERQRLIDAATQRSNDRPRYSDRSRYARRRENQGR